MKTSLVFSVLVGLGIAVVVSTDSVAQVNLDTKPSLLLDSSLNSSLKSNTIPHLPFIPYCDKIKEFTPKTEEVICLDIVTKKAVKWTYKGSKWVYQGLVSNDQLTKIAPPIVNSGDEVAGGLSHSGGLFRGIGTSGDDLAKGLSHSGGLFKGIGTLGDDLAKIVGAALAGIGAAIGIGTRR